MRNFWKDSAELISMKNYIQVLSSHFTDNIDFYKATPKVILFF